MKAADIRELTGDEIVARIGQLQDPAQAREIELGLNRQRELRRSEIGHRALEAGAGAFGIDLERRGIGPGSGPGRRKAGRSGWSASSATTSSTAPPSSTR